MSDAFLSATANAQLQVFTQSGNRPDDGTWADEGAAFRSCLYRPKGGEIPEALSLLDRTMFWLAFPEGTAVTPQKRVVIAGVTYQIHDVPGERTNQLLPVAMVSRLK